MKLVDFVMVIFVWKYIFGIATQRRPRAFGFLRCIGEGSTGDGGFKLRDVRRSPRRRCVYINSSGCVSQVWLRAYFDDLDRKNVIFEADSDALITKGLAALLVEGLSGASVEEILCVSPEFIVLLGLKQSLSPSRNNGFLNMFQLMQKKALMLYVDAEKGVESRSGNAEDPVEDLKTNIDSGSRSNDYQSSTSSGGGDLNPNGSVLGSRGLRIREILNKELDPIELELEDVSYQHAGHVGVKGSNGETHFNLRVVSKEFEGKSLVKRHRLIYSLLDDELQSGLHALSIEAKAPAEVGL